MQDGSLPSSSNDNDSKAAASEVFEREELSGAAAALFALEAIFADSPADSTEDASSAILAMDLFNEISKFAALLILDCRPLEEYQEAHIPRAIHFPIADADVEAQLNLEQLIKNIDKADQRTLMRRQRSTVVVYGKQASYLSSLLTAEGKVTVSKTLQGNFDAFHQKFPFLACSFKTEERKTGKHIHTPPFPWYPNEIVPDSIYLGNHVDADNKLHLNHLQVKHVMNVSNDVENLHTEHFNYAKISLPDNEEEDIGQHFERAFEFLDAAETKGERVFVHCHQGVSRSATILLAYLMYKRSWTLKEAYSYVKEKRKQINPNIGFWRQLEKLEIALRGSSTLRQCVDIDLMEQELKNKKAGLNPDGSSMDAPAAQ